MRVQANIDEQDDAECDERISRRANHIGFEWELRSNPAIDGDNHQDPC